MNIFFRRRARPPARAPRPAPPALPTLPVLWDDEEAPPGCGWFDSSHDLLSGLSVCEHACADAVAADLPLEAWLELHLAGWPGLHRA